MTLQEPVIRIIENENSTFRLLEDGVIHVMWKEGIELEIPDIDDAEVSFNELTEGKTVKVLSQFGRYVNISAEARDYAAARSPECEALAYVITSLAQRIVIRFYIRLRKKNNPTKVFNTYEEALEWLRSV